MRFRAIPINEKGLLCLRERPNSIALQIENDGQASARIGASGDGASGVQYPLDGLVDDVRVWNVARAATEIGDDYGRELNGNETGLVGYWKLNSTLADASGNSNTLTNTNSASFSASPAFAGYSTEVLRVRKATTEALANSTTLQKDDALKLSLAANTSYIIDGVILVSSASASPDFKMALFGQSNIDLAVGYEDDANGVILVSGSESTQIDVPANTQYQSTFEVRLQPVTHRGTWS